MPKINYNRTDTDCHKYQIPDDLLAEFDRLDDAIQESEEWSDEWYNLCTEFNHKFFKYNIGR